MKRVEFITLILVSVVASDARATFLVHSTRDSFDSNSKLLQTIDFEGLAAPGGIASYVTSEGLTQKSVTFTGPYPSDWWLFVAEPEFTPAFYDWGSGAVLLGPSTSFGSGSRIDIALPTGVTAFGTDIMSILPYGASFEITLSSGETFTASSNEYPSRGFWGITSSSPLAGLSITAGESGFPLLDNVTIGIAAPLPPSVILALSGVGSMVLYRFSRRKELARKVTADQKSVTDSVRPTD